MLNSKDIKTPLKSDTIAIGVSLSDKGLKAVIVNKQKRILAYSFYIQKIKSEKPSSWCEGLISLLNELPNSIRSQLVAITINCTEQKLLRFSSDDQEILKGDYFLIDENPQTEKVLLSITNYSKEKEWSLDQKTYLLREKADWLMGWLLENMCFAEESNNITLGWSIKKHDWITFGSNLQKLSILPSIIASGTIAGSISSRRSAILRLPDGCLVVAGSIQDNAATLINFPKAMEGLTLLKDRLTIQCSVESPLISTGILNYRIHRNWFSTGVSRTGAQILKLLFSEHEIKILSHQINSSITSGLHFYPLLNQGEIFPISNLNLESILEPRPISDSLYLHGLIESLSYIESQGLKKLERLSSSTISTVITMGYGISNPQWQLIRKKILNERIIHRSNLIPTAGLAILALNGFYRALGINSTVSQH